MLSSTSTHNVDHRDVSLFRGSFQFNLTACGPVFLLSTLNSFRYLLESKIRSRVRVAASLWGLAPPIYVRLVAHALQTPLPSSPLPCLLSSSENTACPCGTIRVSHVHSYTFETCCAFESRRCSHWLLSLLFCSTCECCLPLPTQCRPS